jgi:hypothetical protein
MLDLGSLLGRFRKSLGRNVLAKESVILAVESITGIRLLPEEINIKEFTLEITSSPIKKNEIKLKEGQILSEVRARTGQNISKIFYK